MKGKKMPYTPAARTCSFEYCSIEATHLKTQEGYIIGYCDQHAHSTLGDPCAINGCSNAQPGKNDLQSETIDGQGADFIHLHNINTDTISAKVLQVSEKTDLYDKVILQMEATDSEGRRRSVTLYFEDIYELNFFRFCVGTQNDLLSERLAKPQKSLTLRAGLPND